jgi:hypothetical protein
MEYDVEEDIGEDDDSEEAEEEGTGQRGDQQPITYMLVEF